MHTVVVILIGLLVAFGLFLSVMLFFGKQIKSGKMTQKTGTTASYIGALLSVVVFCVVYKLLGA